MMQSPYSSPQNASGTEIHSIRLPLDEGQLLSWLQEKNADRLESLWGAADSIRRKHVGDAVHLRGLVEISNHCRRLCGYCGIRAANRTVDRYRLNQDEVLACAHQALAFGYGTVVLQSGEDPGLKSDWVRDLVRRIKDETGLAVTLSLGERGLDELQAWRQAGADRYLLRFETSDPELYQRIHPSISNTLSDRIALLRRLRQMGYEIGSGVMVGIPGQTWESLAQDLLIFARLDLDMVGVGPFIPHPSTPMGQQKVSESADQVPATEDVVYRVVALTRLQCPEANIPSTTALATINKTSGRQLGLQRGANVVMPNLTPAAYRSKYEIYPEKACENETATVCQKSLAEGLMMMGRSVGVGLGGRRHGLVSE